MFTWCYEDDWLDDNFDLDWCMSENGTFSSYEEAKRDADRYCGFDEKPIILNVA